MYGLLPQIVRYLLQVRRFPAVSTAEMTEVLDDLHHWLIASLPEKLASQATFWRPLLDLPTTDQRAHEIDASCTKTAQFVS